MRLCFLGPYRKSFSCFVRLILLSNSQPRSLDIACQELSPYQKRMKSFSAYNVWTYSSDFVLYLKLTLTSESLYLSPSEILLSFVLWNKPRLLQKTLFSVDQHFLRVIRSVLSFSYRRTQTRNPLASKLVAFGFCK